jgi:hypothetical protein
VPFSKRRLLLGAVLIAMIGVAGTLVTTPEPARARKGYGYPGKPPCNNACQVGKCRESCGKTKRTCVFCAQQDKRAGGVACTQTAQQSLGTCTGDKACKKGVRAALKACKVQVKARYAQEKGNCSGLTGGCKGCCGENYSGPCRGVFRGTDGYGTGGTYNGMNYRPDCSVTGEPTPGDPQCQAICERLYANALASCRGGKRDPGDPACVAQAEAERLDCLARCGITPSTTSSTQAPGGATSTSSSFPFPFGSSTSTRFGPLPTSTTSTSTFPPASPRGAFVD